MTASSVSKAILKQGLLQRFCALLVLGLVIHTAPAYSDSTTFLLQLGTSDSEDLATQKWNDAKSKNSDVLGNLSLHIAEVSLPPRNIISYRTQAGPVTSRSQAESLCSTLSSRGMQCYVVETAMFASESAPDQPQEEEKPTPAVTASAPEQHSRKHVVMAEEDTAHADDPDYIPPPVDSGPVIVSTSEAPTPPIVSPSEIAQVTPPASAPEEHVQVEAPRATPTHEEARTEDTSAPASNVQHASSRYVTGREPRNLDDSSETTVAAAAPPPAPALVATTPVPGGQPQSPGFFGRLFGSSPPKPAAAEGVVGSVNVAEAVRVPLSSDNQPPRQKIVPVLPAVHGLGGAPSESTAKTFWAQISYFRDESQALSFYRQFSTSYPQFTEGVRIRIARPFTDSTSANRVSLRVGPFVGTQDVHTICDAANRWNARCTVVRDIGASVALDEKAAATPRENYNPHKHYWAQLGTYSFSQDAWDAWKELKGSHRKILGHVRPSVASPAASSAANPLYRLRAGPFKTENAVTSLCSRLQDEGAGCAVVSEE